MKKITITLVLLVVTATMAQERKSLQGDMQGMTPEQIATLQTNRMTLALDLSETQQLQLIKLFTENVKVRKEKLEEQKAKKESDTLKPTPKDRFTQQNQRLVELNAYKEKIKKILTQKQYEKWKKMQHDKRKHQHDKRKKKCERK